MKNISLQWEADFIDAADDGSMGYNYGNFTFWVVDTSNNPINSTGISILFGKDKAMVHGSLSMIKPNHSILIKQTYGKIYSFR